MAKLAKKRHLFNLKDEVSFTSSETGCRQLEDVRGGRGNCLRDVDLHDSKKAFLEDGRILGATDKRDRGVFRKLKSRTLTPLGHQEKKWFAALTHRQITRIQPSIQSCIFRVHA